VLAASGDTGTRTKGGQAVRQALRRLWRRIRHQPGQHREPPPPRPRHRAEPAVTQRIVIAPKAPPHPPWKDKTSLGVPSLEDLRLDWQRGHGKDGAEGKGRAAVRAAQRAAQRAALEQAENRDGAMRDVPPDHLRPYASGIRNRTEGPGAKALAARALLPDLTFGAAAAAALPVGWWAA
jgi:hypothetical protein